MLYPSGLHPDSVYPSGIPDDNDWITYVDSDTINYGDIDDSISRMTGHFHNRSKAEIAAIAAELGIDPRGSWATVAERLDNIAASGGLAGSGTIDYLPKWIGASGLGNSQIQDDGDIISISGLLSVGGTTTTGGFIMPTDSTNGYVLTTDDSGVGTWQLPSGGVGGLGTIGYIPIWTAPSGLGDSQIQDDGDYVDISGGLKVGTEFWTVDPWIDVRMYGATGDGGTDDTSAIQNAITAAGSAGGGIVDFPAGTYIISAGILMDYSNVVIRGAGREATVLQFTNAGDAFYTDDGANIQYCVMRDLTIETTNANAGAAVNLDQGTYSASHWTFRDLLIQGAGGEWDYGIRSVGSRYGTIDHVFFSGSGPGQVCVLLDGVLSPALNSSNAWTLINCTFGNTYECAVRLNGSTGISIVGGVIQGSADYGVHTRQLLTATQFPTFDITGVHFEIVKVGGVAIYLECADSGFICGCYITGPNVGYAILAGDASNHVRNVVIDANTIINDVTLDTNAQICSLSHNYFYSAILTDNGSRNTIWNNRQGVGSSITDAIHADFSLGGNMDITSNSNDLTVNTDEITLIKSNADGTAHIEANTGIWIPTFPVDDAVLSMPLAEPSGSIAIAHDGSKYAHDGILTGCTWAAAGHIGNAIGFSGDPDRVTIPDHEDLRFGTGDFTIEFWLYGIAGGYPIAKGAYDAPGCWTINSISSKLCFRAQQEVTGSYLDFYAYHGAYWAHYAFIKSGRDLLIYRNGILFGEHATVFNADADFNTTIDLTLGCQTRFGNPANYWEGRLQHVRLHRRVLAGEEVRAHYLREGRNLHITDNYRIVDTGGEITFHAASGYVGISGDLNVVGDMLVSGVSTELDNIQYKSKVYSVIDPSGDASAVTYYGDHITLNTPGGNIYDINRMIASFPQIHYRDNTNVSYMIGSSPRVYNYAGTVTTARGVRAQVRNEGSASISVADGVYSSVDNLDSGSISSAYGLRIGGSNQGTITNNYGIRIAAISDTGTIDNNYGIYINDLAGIGAVSNYSIYTVGGNVYHGDSVEIIGNAGVSGTLTTNAFRLPDTGVGGYVLTSDSTGVGTWQVAASGGGGNVTGTGTAGYIPKWISASGLDDSQIQDDGSTVTIANDLDVLGNAEVSSILTVANTGLHILDTNATHDLIIKPGSDLTADRTLTLTTGDSDRTITFSGNPTLADWFNQGVKTTSSPTFTALTVNGNITVTGTVDGVDVAALKTDVDGFPDELKLLTQAEIQQLENIGATTITLANWQTLSGLSDRLDNLTDSEVQQLENIGALPITYTDWYTIAYMSYRLVYLSDAEIQQLENIGTTTITTTDWQTLAGLSSRLDNLTDAEVQQLENIGTTTISPTQWGYLGAMDQGVATTDSPTFSALNITGDLDRIDGTLYVGDKTSYSGFWGQLEHMIDDTTDVAAVVRWSKITNITLDPSTNATGTYFGEVLKIAVDSGCTRTIGAISAADFRASHGGGAKVTTINGVTIIATNLYNNPSPVNTVIKALQPTGDNYGTIETLIGVEGIVQNWATGGYDGEVTNYASAIYGKLWNRDGGTMTEAKTLLSRTQNLESGSTIGISYGLYVQVENDPGSTIANNLGVFIQTPDNAGTITNNFGLYVQDQSGIGGTLNYAIYVDGGDVYLADNIDVNGILTVPNTGLHILDTNATHDLILKPASNLTADRTLQFLTGDADRAITLNGNPILDDWFSQSVKSTASPTFQSLLIMLTATFFSTVGIVGQITAQGGIDLQAGTLKVADNIGMGTSTFGTSADKVIGFLNGVAPTTSPANTIQLYGYDYSGNHACLHIRNEDGDIIKLEQQPHIVDANGTLGDITTKFNTLLSYLENQGLLATS